jgi:hypothetical protein
MKRDDVSRLVRQAIDLTQDVQSEYRQAAFQEVLRYLIQTHIVGAPREKIPPRERTEGESIGEFLRKVSSRAHTDITLAMAYYLLRYRKVESFTVNDLDALYSEARRPKTNLNLAVNGNIKKGFMIDKGEKREALKLFAISRMGEDHVESDLLKPLAVGD